jgi:hypothetical protein
MKRKSALVFALLPVFGGVIHLSVAVKQQTAERTVQMRRMQNLYKNEAIFSTTSPGAVSRVYPAKDPDRPESASTAGNLLAANRFAVNSISHLMETGRPATIPNMRELSFMPRESGKPLDTSRPNWFSDGVWRVTGVLRYPVKGRPTHTELIGWETEQRWDAERTNWKLVRVVTLPLTAVPAATAGRSVE